MSIIVLKTRTFLNLSIGIYVTLMYLPVCLYLIANFKYLPMHVKQLEKRQFFTFTFTFVEHKIFKGSELLFET